jgi:hypothetical protein
MLTHTKGLVHVDCGRATVVAATPCDADQPQYRTVNAAAAAALCLARAQHDLAKTGAVPTRVLPCSGKPAEDGPWRVADLGAAWAGGALSAHAGVQPCLWNERPEGGNFTGMAYAPCVDGSFCATAGCVPVPGSSEHSSFNGMSHK